MSSKTIRSRDPDIRASAKALRRAAKRAMALGIRTKTPVYVIRDGKVVDLTRSKRIKRSTIRVIRSGRTMWRKARPRKA